ncbi:MAG: helix-turn-helix domain-containing protein [Acidiferrobacterales bacterium]
MGRLKVQFGKRLQQLRRRAGISQEKLADAAGLTVESISNMERGIFGPKFDNLEKIARVLKVPVKVLFDFGKE